MADAVIQLQYPLAGTNKTSVDALHTSGDINVVFEQLFRENFNKLHAYACTMLRDELAAEEIVQQVFCKLWEIREKVDLGGFVAAYLYKAVYTHSMNYLKHNKVKRGYSANVMAQSSEAVQDTDNASLKELQGRIDSALNELPAQCRTVFQMCRFEELKYKEIAERLGISVKTVENHMCKALKLLRKKLAAYLPVLCLLLIR